MPIVRPFRSSVIPSPEAAQSYRLGLLLVTASAVAWSTTGLFMRLIDLDAATVLFWRGLFGAAGLGMVVWVMQGRAGMNQFLRLGTAGWSFALVSGFGMLCFITSLRYTTVAHVSIIYATVPLVAAALAWFVMREIPTRAAVFASLVALVGVGLMVGFGAEGNLFGDLLAFGMTLSLAVMMVLSRRWRNIPTMPAAAFSALLSGIVALPFAAPLAVTGQELGLLALFGLVNSALGLSLFILGARYLPAVETALIGALDAPLAPIWVWLAFAETPGNATLTGGLIVMIAVFAYLARTAR